MSDSSDSDGSPTNNLFTFRNESTIASARGPNINLNNITDLTFRNNNVFSSTLQIPRPYERHRYAHSSYDQRSISNMGENSSRSRRNAHLRRRRNFNSSYSRQGMSGSRSMYNGRSPSPMSVGSIESTASAYVLDIAQALNNADYNEYEWDILEEACYKFFNTAIKRKIKKSYASTSNSSQRSIPVVSNMPTFNPTFKKPPAPMMTQKERFENGYRLPSQRFNRSIIPTSIQENGEIEFQKGKEFQNSHLPMNNSERHIETDSDEEVFSNTMHQNTRNNRKRSIDSEDAFQPNTKRMKPCKSMQNLPQSPCENSLGAQKLKTSNVESNDFVFAKPTCPARRSIKEKLISKSAAPLTDTIPQIAVMPPDNEQLRQDKPDEEFEDEQSNSTGNSTSLSMRPSFIKRKLFTQTLDVTDNANLSTDNIDSPKNSNCAIQKEKHKTRRLQQATTQSCLSRDIEQNESNLIDLIQKIVPVDQINMTNQTNNTISNSKNMTEEENDKQDALFTTSPNKNDDNESETYTDEEMLNHTVKELQKEEVDKKHAVKTKDRANIPNKPGNLKNCIIALDKLPPNVKQPTIKLFWDTDFETDEEITQSPRINKTNLKENNKTEITQPIDAPMRQDVFSSTHSKKLNNASVFNSSSKNYTFDTTQKFNNTLRIRCHKAPKRNRIERSTDENIGPVIQGFNDILMKSPENISAKLTNTEPVTIMNLKDSKKSKTIMTKKDTKKSPKGKKLSDSQTQNIKKSDSDNQTKSKDHTNKTKSKAEKNQRTQILDSNNQHNIVEKISPAKNQSNSKEKNQQTKKQANLKTNISTKIQLNSEDTKSPTKIQPNSKENNWPTKTRSNSKKNNRSSKSRSNSKENNALTKNQTNSKEKLVKSKTTRNKNQNSIKNTQNNNSLMEENYNTASRPMRSCRANSLNQSLDRSILSQNGLMNMTLRSRKNFNSTLDMNNTKLEQKHGNSNLARLSDVSFSLGAENNALAKRTLTKITVSQKSLNADESDVSFSLNPTPRGTRTRESRNTTNSTQLRKNPSRIKMHIWDMKPINATRSRTPNKRYIC